MMPYFAWTGITLTGQTKKGIAFARSEEHLSQNLLMDHIGLMNARITHNRSRIIRPVFCQWSEYVADLLEAGIRLKDVLILTQKTVKNKHLYNVITDCESGISHGASFSSILHFHAPLVDPVIINMIHAGQEAGALNIVFRSIADHYKKQETLSKQLRAALVMPLLTFVGFLIIFIFLFIIIVPRFEQFFHSFAKPIPPLTQKLFAISTFMRHSGFFVFLGCSALLWCVMYFICKHKKYRLYKDLLIWRIALLQTYWLTIFLQTLAILLKSNVHLLAALRMARNTAKNEAFGKQLNCLIQSVEQGKTLSQSFTKLIVKTGTIDQLINLCIMGESTGQLALMIEKAGMIFYNDTYRRLAFIGKVIPIALLLTLGLLVGILVFALYAPLMSLSKFML